MFFKPSFSAIFPFTPSNTLSRFVFNMQIASETKDDFFEFHHVWKSRKDLENDIAGAGLELLKVENENSLEPIFICKNKI